MNPIRQETIETYDRSARQLSEYFQGIGPRTKYIDLAFKLSGSSKPKVVEIGCGDGRDAKEIVQSAGEYIGFDISQGMIKIAKQNVPDGTFKIADALDFKYPSDTDVVFDFASLLHLSREELRIVFYKVAESLRPGGIFYISTKYAPSYQQQIKEDQHGRRLFYLYSPQELKELASVTFETVYDDIEIIGTTKWVEIAFRKSEAAEL